MKSGKKVNIGLIIAILVFVAIAAVGMFLSYISPELMSVLADEETAGGITVFGLATKNDMSFGGFMLLCLMFEDAGEIVFQIMYYSSIVTLAILVWDVVMGILMFVPVIRRSFVATIYKVFTMITGLAMLFLSLIFLVIPIFYLIAGLPFSALFQFFGFAFILLFVGLFVAFILKMCAFGKVGREQ